MFLRPHHRYLASKSASEIIKSFQRASIIFACVYGAICCLFTIVLLFIHNDVDLKVVIPGFLIFMLVLGLSILPKIYETAKLLNEKEIMDIAPALLVLLQFFLNLTLTCVIIPMFLWSKCNDLEKRRQARARNT